MLLTLSLPEVRDSSGEDPKPFRDVRISVKRLRECCLSPAPTSARATLIFRVLTKAPFPLRGSVNAPQNTPIRAEQ